MTHDELLTKIDKNWDADYDYCDDRRTNALRAIVELHKPTSTNDTIFCNVCWAISEEHNLRVMPVVYPCPTIQGIEKELS